MKYCPQCNRQFNEAWLSFCSDDGTPLVQELTPAADPNWDPKIREPRVETGEEKEAQWLPRDQPLPGGWIAPDERPPMNPTPWQPPPQARPVAPNASPYTRRPQPSQGLAMASMITGICGLMLAFCFGPIPGILALVLGIIALVQINKSPDKFGGKPFAIAGVVIGGLSVAFYVLMFIWVILMSALG